MIFINSSDENNSNDSSSENTNGSSEFALEEKDVRDVQILTLQSNAQLILVLGYLLEYKASMQALELIRLKYIAKANDAASGIEDNEETETEREDQWKNEGIDADKTAVQAALAELYGQTFLARLNFIKLQFLADNYSKRDITIAKTANVEIFIGSILEELAYLFNLRGVKILYRISNEDSIYD